MLALGQMPMGLVTGGPARRKEEAEIWRETLTHVGCSWMGRIRSWGPRTIWVLYRNTATSLLLSDIQPLKRA